MSNLTKSKLSFKEINANIQTLRSYLAWLIEDPECSEGAVAETMLAIEKFENELDELDRISEAERHEELAKWGYTGYED